MLLTKSKYLLGLQCFKLLWIQENQPQRMPPVDDTTQAMFDQGHLVGDYAKKLFPGGIDLNGLDFKENIKRTKEAMKEKKPIFEAGFMAGNLYSRVDILYPQGDKWDIIEVKSGTSVKDINLHDVSFQRYCLEMAGFKISQCYLMHINNKYVKHGDIEPGKLFTKFQITEDVEIAMIAIGDRAQKMIKMMKGPEPELMIGPFCMDPYECPLMGQCAKLENSNVFDLYRAGAKAYELHNGGIKSIAEIPDEYELTEHQSVQRKCAISGEPHINKDKIHAFLKGFHAPLSFLDFETFGSAIPMFDGTRPYQQIVFQYSLHIKEGDKLIHHEFLGKGDARRRFIESLRLSLPDKGSIVAYNKSFEIGRLKDIALWHPEYKEYIDSIIPRFIDLMEPFSKFYYYHPLQGGSCSIKSVLPALIGKGYDDLEIADGDNASRSYMKILNGVSDEEEHAIRESLLKYCERDTLAMVWIYERLKTL